MANAIANLNHPVQKYSFGPTRTLFKSVEKLTTNVWLKLHDINCYVDSRSLENNYHAILSIDKIQYRALLRLRVYWDRQFQKCPFIRYITICTKGWFRLRYKHFSLLNIGVGSEQQTWQDSTSLRQRNDFKSHKHRMYIVGLLRRVWY